MTYPERVLLSLDQLLNTLIGGYPDETLSARCYRQGVVHQSPRWRVAYRVVNAIFCWQNNHCQRAYEREKEQKHIASEYRNKS